MLFELNIQWYKFLFFSSNVLSLRCYVTALGLGHTQPLQIINSAVADIFGKCSQLWLMKKTYDEQFSSYGFSKQRQAVFYKPSFMNACSRDVDIMRATTVISWGVG